MYLIHTTKLRGSAQCTYAKGGKIRKPNHLIQKYQRTIYANNANIAIPKLNSIFRPKPAKYLTRFTIALLSEYKTKWRKRYFRLRHLLLLIQLFGIYTPELFFRCICNADKNFLPVPFRIANHSIRKISCLLIINDSFLVFDRPVPSLAFRMTNILELCSKVVPC